MASAWMSGNAAGVADAIKSGSARELLMRHREAEMAKKSATSDAPNGAAPTRRRSILEDEDWERPPRSVKGGASKATAQTATSAAEAPAYQAAKQPEASANGAEGVSATRPRDKASRFAQETRSKNYGSEATSPKATEAPTRAHVPSKTSEDAPPKKAEPENTLGGGPTRRRGQADGTPDGSPAGRRGRARENQTPDVYTRASEPRSQRSLSRPSPREDDDKSISSLSPRSRSVGPLLENEAPWLDVRSRKAKEWVLQRIPDPTLDGINLQFLKNICFTDGRDGNAYFVVWKHHVRVQRAHMQTLIGKWVDSLSTLKHVVFKSWLTDMQTAKESHHQLVETTTRVMKKMVAKRCEALSKTIEKRNSEMLQEFVAFCWQRWSQNTKDAKATKRAKDKARKQAMGKYNLVGQQGQTIVFSFWRDHVTEVLQEAMANAEICKLAFSGWLHANKEMNAARDKRDKVQQNMMHALNMATEALATQCFHLWKEDWKETGQKKEKEEEVLKRFAIKFSMGQEAFLHATFRSWNDLRLKNKEKNRKDKDYWAKLALKLGAGNQQLSQIVFTAIHTFTQESKAEVEKAHAAKQEKIQACMMKIGVAQEKLFALSFHGWMISKEKDKEHKQRVKQLTMKMGLRNEAMQTLIVQGWAQELVKAAAKRNRDEQVRKSSMMAIGNKQNQLMTIVVMEWHKHTKEREVDRKHRQHILQKTMRNVGMQNQMLLGQTIEQWDLVLREENTKREREEMESAHANDKRRARIMGALGKKDEHIQAVFLRAWDISYKMRLEKNKKHAEREAAVKKQQAMLGNNSRAMMFQGWAFHLKELRKKKSTSDAMTSSMNSKTALQGEVLMVHVFHLWCRWLHEEFRKKDRDDACLKSIVQRLGMESSHLKVVVVTSWRFTIANDKALGICRRKTKADAKNTWVNSMTTRNLGSDQDVMLMVMKTWSTLTLSEVEKADLLSQFVGHHVNTLVSQVKSPHRDNTRLHQRAMQSQLAQSGNHEKGVEALGSLHQDLKDLQAVRF